MHGNDVAGRLPTLGRGGLSGRQVGQMVSEKKEGYMVSSHPIYQCIKQYINNV